MEGNGGDGVTARSQAPSLGTGPFPQRGRLEFEPVTEPEAPNPELNGDSPQTPAWQAILDAPDYIQLLKGRKTETAKEYQVKVESVLKEALKYRLGAGTATGLADVSAILAYGPEFAERAGQLADYDERAKKALDLLTAPDNPWFLFAFAVLPFFSQILRNHEDQIKEHRNRPKKTREEKKAERAARPKAYVTVGKRKIRVPFRFKFQLGFFRQQSADPQTLINHVMSSDKVRRALNEKYGVKIAPTSD